MLNFIYNAFSVLIGIVFTVIFIYGAKRFNMRKKYQHIPGPELKGVKEFLFGNLSELQECISKRKTFSEKYIEWSKKHGSVFKYEFFGNIIVVTNEPTIIKEIVVKRNVPKDDFLYNLIGYPFGERFIGQGLVTEIDNEKWRTRRALFRPAFHKEALAKCVEQFNLKADSLLKKLNNFSDKNTQVVLLDELNLFALDTIASVAFGLNIDSINNPKNDLSTFIKVAFEGINFYLRNPLIKLNPFKKAKIEYYRNTIRELRKLAKKIISDRLKSMENNEESPDDILKIIIECSKQEQIDIEDLIDDFITFFNAGQETTANTLAFCFLELGKNPHIVKKLRQEIDEIVGSKEAIDLQDVNNLEYTGFVIKETLRLWPPAAEFFRQSTEGFTVNGIYFPKETKFSVSPFLCGRNEKYFNEPEQFKPERFSKQIYDDLETRIENYTYFPFSFGPRNCIGQNFAMIQSKIFVAKFIQNFDFKLVPNQSMDAMITTTIKPRDGTKVFLFNRNKTN